eukprot:gene14070-20408_t
MPPPPPPPPPPPRAPARLGGRARLVGIAKRRSMLVNTPRHFSFHRRRWVGMRMYVAAAHW